MPRPWFTLCRLSNSAGKQIEISNHCSNPSAVSARWNALWKDKKRIFFVPVANVLWIEATGNYACIHTASDSHLLRETLAHLEEKLAPQHFIRVRKSAIVNGACISEIRPMFDGVYDIVLAEGTVVTSSRRYAHKLRALLES